MPELIMTGYSELDFIAQGHDENLRCCFLCKRTEKDHSVVISEGEIINPRIELMPYSIKVMDSDLIARFYFCQECYLIVNSLGKTGEFQNKVKEIV